MREEGIVPLDFAGGVVFAVVIDEIKRGCQIAEFVDVEGVDRRVIKHVIVGKMMVVPACGKIRFRKFRDFTNVTIRSIVPDDIATGRMRPFHAVGVK